VIAQQIQSGSSIALAANKFREALTLHFVLSGLVNTRWNLSQPREAIRYAALNFTLGNLTELAPVMPCGRYDFSPGRRRTVCRIRSIGTATEMAAAFPLHHQTQGIGRSEKEVVELIASALGFQIGALESARKLTIGRVPPGIVIITGF